MNWYQLYSLSGPGVIAEGLESKVLSVLRTGGARRGTGCACSPDSLMSRVRRFLGPVFL